MERELCDICNREFEPEECVFQVTVKGKTINDLRRQRTCNNCIDDLGGERYDKEYYYDE